MTDSLTWTGQGSWPGSDFAAAQRLILGEYPRLPYLPELPARGPGATSLGRAVAVLADLTLDLSSTGWRLADHAGMDQRRARALWRDDLDRLEETAQGYAGPLVVSLPGPWTLAASIDTPRSDKVLGDPGARRDLGQSLATGLAELAGDLRRRLPGVSPVLKLAEPRLGSVLEGAVRTASGWDRFRRVDRPEVSDGLAAVVQAAGDTAVVVDSLEAGQDLSLVLGAGAGVSRRVAGLTGADRDILGEAIERAAVPVWLGVLDTRTERSVNPDALATTALSVLRPMELDPVLTRSVVLTPDGGLATWSPAGALNATRALARAAEIVADALSR